MNGNRDQNPSVQDPGEGAAGILWRSWPCTRCRGIISPVSFLRRRLEASPASASLPEEVAQQQAESLIRWVESCEHHGWVSLPHRKLAQGSEHAVYLNETKAEVIKATLPGTFGEYYFLNEKGRVLQEKATALEYLVRLRLWRNLFRGAPVATGVTATGQVLSAQRFISGEVPTQEEVDSFLELAGLEAVRKDCWLWRTKRAGITIWLGDARADNFVKRPGSIVPIDVRLWGEKE